MTPQGKPKASDRDNGKQAATVQSLHAQNTDEMNPSRKADGRSATRKGHPSKMDVDSYNLAKKTLVIRNDHTR